MVYSLSRAGKLLIGLLLLILISTTLTSFIIASGNAADNREQLFKLTRRRIPSNLPWYPLAVIGDNRPHDASQVRFPQVFYMIVDEIRETKPLGVIGTGDHVGRGAKPQIDELYNTLRDLENVWLVLGNHDIYTPGNITYWEKLIGPQYYYIDDIPGWKIFFIDSEARLSSEWIQQVNWVFQNLKDDEAGILVFHRPVYPYVEHNLDSERIKPLLSAIKQHDHVKLVIQGHWHGFAVTEKLGITWIITGGAGAPLYYYPKKPYEPNIILVKGKYHYLYLILFPNQTYTYYPIRADAASGKIVIDKINETAYTIENTKRSIFNNYTYVPVRVSYHYKNWTIYAVILAPPNKDVTVNFKPTSYTVEVICTANTWYAYAPRKNSSTAIVANGVDHHAVLVLGKKPATTTRPTTTSPSETTTTTQPTPTTSTAKSNNPTTTTPTSGVNTGLIIAVTVVIIGLVIGGVFLVRKH